jgi:acyl-CoA thioesterase I
LIRNIVSYGALILLIQVLIGCGSTDRGPKLSSNSDVAATQAEGITRLIVAFGDSLYAGYQLGPKDGFAPQLQSTLRKNGLPVSVLNAGVSGDTSAAGRARLNFVLDNTPQPATAVILGLGGNDMLRGIKPEETRANISAMLAELKRRKVKVILTGMLASPNMGPDYAKKFNAIFPELAAEYNAPLYPFFLQDVVTDRTQMLPDGIHPNKQGVATIVNGIAPIISAAFKDTN